jgi:hypothetical protein
MPRPPRNIPRAAIWLTIVSVVGGGAVVLACRAVMWRPIVRVQLDCPGTLEPAEVHRRVATALAAEIAESADDVERVTTVCTFGRVEVYVTGRVGARVDRLVNVARAPVSAGFYWRVPEAAGARVTVLSREQDDPWAIVPRDVSRVDLAFRDFALRDTGLTPQDVWRQIDAELAPGEAVTPETARRLADLPLATPWSVSAVDTATAWTGPRARPVLRGFAVPTTTAASAGGMRAGTITPRPAAMLVDGGGGDDDDDGDAATLSQWTAAAAAGASNARRPKFGANSRYQKVADVADVRLRPVVDHVIAMTPGRGSLLLDRPFIAGCGLITLGVAGGGTWWWRRRRLDRLRRRRNLCRVCGYDLQGSIDRCGECGALRRSRMHAVG